MKITSIYTKLLRSFYWLGVIAITLIAILLRILIFDQVGGDWLTYKQAVSDFTQGINPYIYTVTSFQQANMDHGYAYLPTLLYIQSATWLLSNLLSGGNPIPSYILWKIPVLLCDLGIGLLILRETRRDPCGSVGYFNIILYAFWLLNPYLMARYEYSLFDPLFLFMLLVALILCPKNSLLSGVFFGLAVSLKTIPLIVLPLVFLATKRKIKFTIGFIFILMLLCIPFMVSMQDFTYFINGTLLVHGERGIQGRPILSFLSYYLYPYGINFFQTDFSKVYSIMALLSAAVVTVIVYLKKVGIFEFILSRCRVYNRKSEDTKVDRAKVQGNFLIGILKKSFTTALVPPYAIYCIVTVGFLIYLLLTPVLSRTHLLWPLPFFLIAVGKWVGAFNGGVVATKGADSVVTDICGTVNDIANDAGGSLKNIASYKDINITARRLNLGDAILLYNLLLVIVVYAALFGYLFVWNTGIKPGYTFGACPVLESTSKPWEFERLLRHKYYEIRTKFF